MPKIKAPVLMFHGLADIALHRDGLAGTWDWVEKDLTLVTVPGAGHFVQQDAAELVSSTMSWWLTMRAPRSGRRQPLTTYPRLCQRVAHARPDVALQLDPAFDNRSARTARALQLLTEIFQELGILRQSVDNGDGLAPASLLFHPHLRDDARRDRIVGCCVPGAALAVPLRPAADRDTCRLFQWSTRDARCS